MTEIQWTEKTWNPIRGCSRVSKGCRNCYAEKVAHRFSGPGLPYEGLTNRRGQWNGEIQFVPEKLQEPLRRRKPTTYFVNSMSDLFHPRVSDGEIAAVFGVMAACPQHQFQVLTKRPERALEWFGWVRRQCDEHWSRGEKSAPLFLGRAAWMSGHVPAVMTPKRFRSLPWPLPNVWLGVSVEDQRTADERIPLLLQIPAAVRWVSAEPLLEGVDVRPWVERGGICECGTSRGTPAGCEPARGAIRCNAGTRRLSWVVVGGESGPDARPCDRDWIHSVVGQCSRAGVPVFVKQLGARPRDMSQCESCLDQSICWCVDSDIELKDKKGGDPDEWPEDLRVRQFPEEVPHA